MGTGSCNRFLFGIRFCKQNLQSGATPGGGLLARDAHSCLRWLRTEYDRKHSLPGATLTEVLVVMIVAGIVLLAVMDGLGLLRRHASAVGERITVNSRFYEGYYRLEDIVTNADSVTRAEGGGVVCWRGGAEAVMIGLVDSMLVAHYGSAMDTLMDRVAALRAVHRPEAVRVDTVAVEIGGDRPLTLAFPATPPVQIVAWHDIAEIEKEYEYE